MSEKLRAGCAAYVRFFESLSADTLDQLDAVTAEDVHFRDPFNDVRGRECMRAVLAQMFEAVREPRFEVRLVAWDGDVCVLVWRFTGEVKHLGPWDVEGSSELSFDEAGRVTRHIDHWDSGAAFDARLPVLGFLLRLVRRRLRVRTPDERTE